MFEREDIIHEYTIENAILDEVFIEVGKINDIKILFTKNLFLEGFDLDVNKRISVIKKGLNLLDQDNEEDSEYMKMRVIDNDQIWVIYNYEGITFMKPEDY